MRNRFKCNGATLIPRRNFYKTLQASICKDLVPDRFLDTKHSIRIFPRLRLGRSCTHFKLT